MLESYGSICCSYYVSGLPGFRADRMVSQEGDKLPARRKEIAFILVRSAVLPSFLCVSGSASFGRRTIHSISCAKSACSLGQLTHALHEQCLSFDRAKFAYVIHHAFCFPCLDFTQWQNSQIDHRDMQRYKDLSTALATVSVSNFAGLTATQEGAMGRIRLRRIGSFRHPVKKAEVFHGSNDSTCHVGPCGGVRIGLTLAADLVHR
jgi:hypothetical protein